MSAESCREELLIASVLLAYPDTENLGRIRGVEASSAHLPRRVRDRVERFVHYLGDQDPIALQQDYVRTFDFQGGVPLYLTYPKFGDERARGQALVDLRQRYRTAGFEPVSRELPDFLPVVLEFLGLADPPAARPVAREYLGTVRDLARRLYRAGSPYRSILETACEAMAELAGETGAGRREP